MDRTRSRALDWGLGLVLGLVLGVLAGRGLVHDLPVWENGTTDLLPSWRAWSLPYWFAVLSWIAAIPVALLSRRGRPFALGWLIGVPVLLTISVVYAGLTFGTWGTVPEP